MYLTENAVTNLNDFLKHFQWPLSEDDKLKIGRGLIEQYAKLLRTPRSSLHLKILKIIIFSYYYAAQSLVCQCLIYQRAMQQGYQYAPPFLDKGYFYQSINLPIEYELVNVFVQDFSLKKYKNWIKWILGRMPGKAVFNGRLDFNVVFLEYLNSQTINSKTIYLQQFLSPLGRKKISNKDTVELIEELTELTVRISPEQIRQNTFFLKSLKNLSTHLVEGAMAYYLQAENSLFAKKIKNLYSGTQGRMSSRIVSEAIRTHGGKVHTFPHTGGFLGGVDHCWMIETLTTSYLYCYTSAELENYAKQLKDFQVKSEVELILLPQSFSPAKRIKKRKITHVTYLAPLLKFEDHIFSHMITPNLSLLYLQCQILDVLVKEEITIALKVHRKDLGSPILDHRLNLLKQRYNNLIIEMTPLEELINSDYSTDLYISDNITGGSLIEVIKTDAPIALFTACFHIIPPEIREEFQERVRVFFVEFDTLNRPAINSEEFKNFLSNNENFNRRALSALVNEHFAY